MHYEEILNGYKNDNFSMKKNDTFLIFAQNINCGYTLEQLTEAVPKYQQSMFNWGSSNEYPQSMF